MIDRGKALAEKLARRTFCRLTCHRFDHITRGHIVCRQCGWEYIRTSS